jgi:endonuclease/exonuclease/phosphatase family metal-dependent hydrolase
VPRLLRLSLAAVAALTACSGGESATDPAPPAPTPPAERPPVVVPAQGAPTTFDIATWNVLWFGQIGNGPTDENLQQLNVRDAMAGADLDAWGLQEVVNTDAFRRLVSGLAGYTGVLANDTTVQLGPQYYSDFGNTEQKVALIWRTSAASLQRARVILPERDFEFAGRPPVEFQLRVTIGSATEDVSVVVLHGKADTDTVSWRRRRDASLALKTWLDSAYTTRKVFVIGDFNDDLDQSITTGRASPYANFMADTARWRAPTLALSQAGTRTILAFPDAIDHHVVTRAAGLSLVTGSVGVIRLDTLIRNYATTTADHLPVLARYRIGPP